MESPRHDLSIQVEIEDHLLSLNGRGIFPGPSESREHFLRRVLAVKDVSTSADSSPTKEIFGAFPDWVEIKFSSKGLLPWEGAATWIEESEECGRISSIQLKSSLLAHLYPRAEVIAHEMVHAMRLMFEESRFEEILAFRTSKNRFRRFFGPLFTQPRETKGFVFLMVCSWAFYVAEFALDVSLGANVMIWSPLSALGWGAYRLIRSQNVFSAALNHLEKAMKKPGQSLAVALRLTDREIEQFAKSSPNEIISFAEREKEMSLRWKQIYTCYFG
jgi:hypothetical protein